MRDNITMSDGPDLVRLRLDIWLDVACLFRTRSEAQKACQMGRVHVNDQKSKAHRELRAGDRLLIQWPGGRRQQVVVRGLTEKHIAKAEARLLYEDVTPPPTQEELDLRRLAKLTRPKPMTTRAPDRDQRRELRRLKESD